MGTDILQIGNWVVRYKTPAPSQDANVLVMLHGWTGDENAMWVFARNLPDNFWILAPRGTQTANETGYGWTRINAGFVDYRAAAVDLMQGISTWFEALQIKAGPFSVFGFSQGAAMALSLVLLFPDQIKSAMSVAGFLPADANDLSIRTPLNGKPIYIAHGTQDLIVPVEKARSAARFLTDCGADVTYCENNVGHKLSLDCFKGLEEFIVRHH